VKAFANVMTRLPAVPTSASGGRGTAGRPVRQETTEISALCHFGVFTLQLTAYPS
jgi:hypothetical protein